MAEDKLDHPAAERLSAFGLGQLDPAEAAEVERHVADCAACCQTLSSLPDDRLVKVLHWVFNSKSLLSGPGVEATVARPSTTAPGPQVPAELAEHPRYRIVEVLGTGGMGVVYKAEHRLMERPVALKVIDRGLTGNTDVVERFHHEVKAAAQLNHPNIVHAYDADQAGDSHFLVMEFVEGTTLARLVEQQGPLPVAQACDAIRQAALGLQRAAEHGMVHRDIKPHNLMRTSQGQIKILDFGLARLVREIGLPVAAPTEGTAPAPRSLTQFGMVMGTADYMAPEQAADAHAADGRADIYSLGCTLYFLLTGQPPFPEGTMRDKLLAHRQDKPRPLSDFRDDVPAALARIVERMMDKDPDRRCQTPAEVAEGLRPFLGPRPRRSRWIWYAAAAVLLLFGAVAAAVATILIRTDQGEFVLETDDPDIAVRLDKAGVQIHDRRGKRTYLLKVGKQRMDTGTYDIDVSELPAGIEISSPTFRLRRGETWRLSARVRPSPDKAVGPAVDVLKSFGPKDQPISRDGITAEQGGWRIEATERRTVRLFEIVNPAVEECQVIYQAKLKTEKQKGKAYLEMWCRFPGKGEFFSKGIWNPVSGTMDWASYEIPFFLKKGERPDLIKLNVVLEGAGTLWIKDITVRKAGLL